MGYSRQDPGESEQISYESLAETSWDEEPLRNSRSEFAWREPEGSYTSMGRLASGGVQFCSYYTNELKDCAINLLGPVQRKASRPLALMSEAPDGNGSFNLVWDSGISNLGHLNRGFMQNAVKLRVVRVRWRPNIQDQEIEHSFTIPVRVGGR